MYVSLKLYVSFQFINIGQFLILAVKALFSLVSMILLPITLLVAVALLPLCFWSICGFQIASPYFN